MTETENSDGDLAPNDPSADAGPIMPGDQTEPSAPAPPSSAARQIAQLVIIPALIVLAGIGAAMLFVWVASTQESIEDQVNRMRGCGALGKGPLGFQDPRYKDCWHAAFNIANRIDQITSPRQRATLHGDLAELLAEQAASEQDESRLSAYLLMAIGRLGQDGGLPLLVRWLDSPSADGRRGALEGLMAWPDAKSPRGRRAARRALPQMTVLLADPEAEVALRAAAVLGELALPQEQQVHSALHEAMGSEGLGRRYVRWQAAVALARLGDRVGSRLVAELLLDREQLSTQPDGIVGKRAREMMRADTQDDIILSTLMVARDFTDQAVWDKIDRLAELDPSPMVKRAARQLNLERRKSTDATTSSTPPDR
jgi:hypothetical protein